MEGEAAIAVAAKVRESEATIEAAKSNLVQQEAELSSRTVAWTASADVLKEAEKQAKEAEKAVKPNEARMATWLRGL